MRNFTSVMWFILSCSRRKILEFRGGCMILESKAQKLNKDNLQKEHTRRGTDRNVFFLVSFPTENKSRSFYFSTCFWLPPSVTGLVIFVSVVGFMVAFFFFSGFAELMNSLKPPWNSFLYWVNVKLCCLASQEQIYPGFGFVSGLVWGFFYCRSRLSFVTWATILFCMQTAHLRNMRMAHSDCIFLRSYKLY